MKQCFSQSQLGLPLTTTVVSGNAADDPLYIPEIQRIQQTVGAGGRTHSTLRAEIDQAAVAAAKHRLGWRVYATHQADFTLEAVVRAYREQYRIERNFERLKGWALAITPLFLQTETRGPGLIRLLSLALWGLILVEFVARRHLADTHSKVTSLYPGQSARAPPPPRRNCSCGLFGVSA